MLSITRSYLNYIAPTATACKLHIVQVTIHPRYPEATLWSNPPERTKFGWKGAVSDTLNVVPITKHYNYIRGQAFTIDYNEGEYIIVTDETPRYHYADIANITNAAIAIIVRKPS